MLRITFSHKKSADCNCSSKKIKKNYQQHSKAKGTHFFYCVPYVFTKTVQNTVYVFLPNKFFMDIVALMQLKPHFLYVGNYIRVSQTRKFAFSKIICTYYTVQELERAFSVKLNVNFISRSKSWLARENETTTTISLSDKTKRKSRHHVFSHKKE